MSNPFEDFMRQNIEAAEEEKRQKEQQTNNQQFEEWLGATYRRAAEQPINGTQGQVPPKPKMCQVRKISNTEYEIILP